MTPQQILDKLAARQLTEALNEGLSRLAFTAMCHEKKYAAQQSYVLSKILSRWNVR